MNDAIDIRIFLEDGKSIIIDTEINFIILYDLTGNFFNRIQDPLAAPGIIICRDNIKTIFDQVDYGMCTNITTATGTRILFICKENKKSLIVVSDLKLVFMCLFRKTC